MARTSVLTGGSNGFQTTSEDLNAVATDFVGQGVVGTVANSAGVAPMTGGLALNAQGTPNMTVAVTAGIAYVTTTPSGQGSQNLRVKIDAQNVTIQPNSTGSTRYDYVYVKVDPTLANNPDASGATVGTIFTSRSTVNTSDNGTPPSYGLLLGVVTVINGASSITNGNIADKRVAAALAAPTDGSLNPSILYDSSERIADHITSGGVITFTASTLNWSMTGGVCYIGGKRHTFASASGSVTASKDTYFDLHSNGDGTASLVNTGGNIVANGAASPALAASSVRNGKVVSSASAITSVTQAGVDSLFNPIASKLTAALAGLGGVVQTQLNGGSAGGNNNFINLGGIKILWGVSGNQYTIANGTGSVSQTVNFPSSFFSTTQYWVCQVTVPGVDGRQSSYISSTPATSGMTMVAANLSGSANVTGFLTWLVIGT